VHATYFGHHQDKGNTWTKLASCSIALLRELSIRKSIRELYQIHGNRRRTLAWA
jgi:hypothetical protein